MGLTEKSVGKGVKKECDFVKMQLENSKVIALAGNPNVGKSTVFNSLTGMNQHTGNWPGKTVASAQGVCKSKNNNYIFVDIPGTYSLLSHSTEEEIARNFLCFNNYYAVVAVCDATCLERNLNLVLQILEITERVVVCVNLMDEAKRKKIDINIPLLQKRLGVPVITTVAKQKKSVNYILTTLDNFGKDKLNPIKVIYENAVEEAINIIKNCLKSKNLKGLNSRWISLKLLESDENLKNKISTVLGENFLKDPNLQKAIKKANSVLQKNGITQDILRDKIVSKTVWVAENICKGAVIYNEQKYSGFDRKADKILTSKITGYPIMILLLLVVFWLTISGSNYLSELLSGVLFKFGEVLYKLLLNLKVPYIVCSAVTDGIYKVLAWVVAVMLPPMAIFFPLFTLLEDSGYLPRIAYNLDKPFKKCNACGKQSLTMCMGFGCNAAGVVGCRIIDSERERLLAILTNSFVPCNGRFPALISLITMFFVGTVTGFVSTIKSAIILTAVILTGIGVTFAATYFLSKTVLKGKPSSFTLELPSYRRPQIISVIIRSLMDRTLFVLGRAVSVAAPAGLIIWIMSNVTVENTTLLNVFASYLNPFAELLGLDGIILTAFILGFPANEIVIPIIIMAYMGKTSILELSSLAELKNLFVTNGWDKTTALCYIVFSLFHWPCSTTVLTVKKETGSFKWTAVAFLLPVLIGTVLCFLINMFSKIF